MEIGGERMFEEYRNGFKKAIKDYSDEWMKLKWYEKAGVYICGPIAYGIGKLSGLMEILKEVGAVSKKTK